MTATEQQWEYCQLLLYGRKEKKGQWFYDFDIHYFGPQGSRYYTISRIKGNEAKAWPYNPWERAFGLLGAAGWELVAAHHGLYAEPKFGYYAGSIHLGNAVAYFKRPVQPWRGVDEPKLVLE